MIVSFRKELRSKRRYLDLVLADYPELAEVIDPVRDLHTMSFDELKATVSTYKEHYRMERAARRI